MWYALLDAVTAVAAARLNVGDVLGRRQNPEIEPTRQALFLPSKPVFASCVIAATSAVLSKEMRRKVTAGRAKRAACDSTRRCCRQPSGCTSSATHTPTNNTTHRRQTTHAHVRHSRQTTCTVTHECTWNRRTGQHAPELSETERSIYRTISTVDFFFADYDWTVPGRCHPTCVVRWSVTHWP